jgi:hypothetical protein
VSRLAVVMAPASDTELHGTLMTRATLGADCAPAADGDEMSTAPAEIAMHAVYLKVHIGSPSDGNGHFQI